MTNEQIVKCLDDLIEKPQNISMQISWLREWSNRKSPLIKSLIAEVLANCNDTTSKEVLLKLLCDKNSLVRTEAADSLSQYPYDDVLQQLKIVAENDNNHMVRGYALLSMTLVSMMLKADPAKYLSFLHQRCKREKSVFCKLNCYHALYIMGEKDKLEVILLILKSRNYRNRCAVVNTLYDVVNESNRLLVVREFKKQLLKENSEAVISTINGFLRKYDNAN